MLDWVFLNEKAIFPLYTPFLSWNNGSRVLDCELLQEGASESKKAAMEEHRARVAQKLSAATTKHQLQELKITDRDLHDLTVRYDRGTASMVVDMEYLLFTARKR